MIRIRSPLLFFLLAPTLLAGPMDDGERAYLARDYATALAHYKKALTHDLNEENRARCWYMIGQANLMLGNLRDARQAFSTIKTRYAHTEWLAHAYLGLGDAYARANNHTAALAAYKNSLSSRFAAQFAPSVYYRMARSHRALGQLDQAAKLEARIRSSFPESLEARLVLNNNHPPRPAPAYSPTPPKKLYSVQVAFSPRAEFAADLANKLKRKGYSAFVDRSTIKNQNGYRVLVGRFQGPEAAQALAQKLKSAENLPGFVTTLSTD